VLGRVHYRQGYTLSTPLWTADPEARPAPDPVPATYPDPRDGLGWEWDMAATQFYGNNVRLDPAGPGRVRLTRDPGKTDTAPGFFLNMFAHPGWNTGAQQAVTLGLRTDPPAPLGFANVTLTLRGANQRQLVTARLPVTDNALTVDLAAFPDFPPMFVWRSVVRLHVQLETSARTLIIGPLRRIAPVREGQTAGDRIET
ncbi:MAG: hypothetical protein JW951_04140, partial [Lentisphaerae bacterium]|nr:hypothetical protein [Lentisphaerota bacterium]